MCFGSNLRTVTHSLTDMPTSRDAVASKNVTKSYVTNWVGRVGLDKFPHNLFFCV